MDPQIRWLRRHVQAGVAERVAIEAIVAAVVVATASALVGGRPAEVTALALTAAMALALLRVGLALATNPINHRYLLRWDDPTVGLTEVPVGPDDPVDRSAFEPRGLSPLARLEVAASGSPASAIDAETSAETSDDNEDEDEERVRPPGLDLYRADRGRLLVTVGDDGVVTVLSRLADGRSLVTSTDFVPPSDRLVVQRVPDPASEELGDLLDRLVVEQVGRLLQLRADGIEVVETGVDAVLDGLRAEWEAWQDIGPFIGPLIRLDHRSQPGVALQVAVPATPPRSGQKDPRHGNGGSDPSVPVVRASSSAPSRRQ